MDKLILTDMDGTLLGNEAALEQFKQWLGERPDVGFGVVTGRSKASAFRGLEEAGIDECDVVVCAVGTEIYYGRDRIQDQAWVRRLDALWDRELLSETLGDIPLRQEPNSQEAGRWKLSYQGEDAARHCLEVQARLRRDNLEASVVLSHDYYLDVLPPFADKAHAVLHVTEQFEMVINQVLVAGDSANDSSMLTLPGVNAVLVGNHLEEVLHLNGHPSVYTADAHHAAGILEGIDYYAFDR